MRPLLAALVVILCAAPCRAQEISITPTDRLAWTQTAESPTQAAGFFYDVLLDKGLPSEAVIRLSNVTCDMPMGVLTPTPGPQDCKAPMPAFATGSHTIALKTVTMRSIESNTLSVNRTQNDPRCIVPTGSAAIQIFPTRFIVAGQKGAVLFQLGTPSIHNVVQVNVLLVPDAGGPTLTMPPQRGEALNDVAGGWFLLPPTKGYKIQLRATNAIGCTTTSATPYRY